MFHVKLFHKLLEFRCHGPRLIDLLLRYLTAVEHFLDLLLWVTVKCVTELPVLVYKVLNVAHRRVLHDRIKNRIIHLLFLSSFVRLKSPFSVLLWLRNGIIHLLSQTRSNRRFLALTTFSLCSRIS